MSSDGASKMLYECYLRKLRVVNFIHDEIISELTIKPAHLLLAEIHSIEKMMVDTMSEILPDVKIAVESGLMNRWYKEAEGLLDADGDLRVCVDVQNGEPIWEKVKK